MFHDDFADLPSRSVGFEQFDIGVGQERNVGMLECRVYRTHLSVRLSIDETGKAIASLAADTAARLRVFLVEHDAQRRVKGTQTHLREVIG